MDIQFTKKELDNVLYDEDFTPEKLIGFLSIELGEIYNADAGVWEGYTIGEHTIMVMRQFERYFSDKQLPNNIDRGIFRLMLALHDVGKAEAIANGNKDDQHKYTVDIIEEIFDALLLSNKDIATTLIGADYLGRYIRGRTEIQETIEAIKCSAKRTDMGTQDFFELLTIFYRCDAGSYTEDSGGLKSLDHLFIFDREKPILSFAPDVLVKIQKLENTLTLQ